MSSVNPIPPGFHSLTAHLSVEGAAAYIDFLKKAFDAEELGRSPGPGGKLMHALVKVGDSMLMLHDDMSAEFHMPPPVRTAVWVDPAVRNDVLKNLAVLLFVASVNPELEGIRACGFPEALTASTVTERC